MSNKWTDIPDIKDLQPAARKLIEDLQNTDKEVLRKIQAKSQENKEDFMDKLIKDLEKQQIK